MKKVLLAVGHRQLEEYLKSKLNKEFIFVGTTVYREGVLRAIGQKAPDIVVLRETLDGSENIMSIVYQIRANYPDVRIVFIAGNREPGDELLANLVNYGVYDVLYGANIQARKIVLLIRKGNTYAEVKHLQPVPVLDENRNRMLFKAPTISKEVNEHKNDSSEQRKKENEKAKQDIDKEKENENEKKSQVDKGKKEVSPKKTNTVTVDEKTKKNNNKGLFESFKIPKLREDNNKSKKKMQTFSGITEVVNERIITFIGGKNGVGTTSIAINSAFLLAEKGYKVVYIELNDKCPSVSYWYELGFNSEGIDTCLESISKNRYEKIDEAIVKTKKIREEKTPMKKNYKRFPETLDFMFFSKRYMAGLKDKVEFSNFKELYLYLMYQMNYDYVIIDVLPDINNGATQSALVYSNKVFSVITQDISSIGYHLFNLNTLEKRGFNLLSKNNFIINFYEKAFFREKDIKKWLDIDEVLIVPFCNKDFIEANFKGLPVVFNSKNRDLLVSINEIVSIIMKK